MGAGSAKGLRKSASADEADKLSISSDGQWVEGVENETTSELNNTLVEGKRSKSFDFPTSTPKQSELRVTTDQNKEVIQPRKKKIWTSLFNSEKEDKNEEDEEDIGESEEIPQKETSNQRRFRIFGGKKKDQVKDEKLDSEINDLEKTFDSLGIVGKSVWEGGQDIKPKQQSKDDLATLEPMRNRLNVRMARPPRGINGLSVSSDFLSGRRADQDLNSTSGSKKKFNFSWDTEEEDKESVEVDEWDYRAVKIDGFDINKFKKANVDANSAINGRVSPIPTIMRFSPDTEKLFTERTPEVVLTPSRNSPSPPLQYDADDQQILASIERALMEN